MKIYTESDFVKVVDAAGNEQPPVPKAWVGKDLLPEGTKRPGRGGSSTSSTQQQSPAPSGDGQPAGNASRDDWAAYAKSSKGATDADLVDDKGEPLGRDEIKAKYGTQPS